MMATLATRGVESTPHADPVSPGWCAELELEFDQRDGRTLLLRRRHRGPLLVQRAFYPEGSAVCHLYVLHPPGGLVGGDQLAIDVTVKPKGAALLTTPAAGKVYRTAAEPARQRVSLTVGSEAALEWLPQETIVFDRAHLRASLSVDLARGARFIGWDAVCFGRRASGESFERGAYRQCIELRRDGELLLVEPLLVEPGSRITSAPWGLAHHSIAATLLATPASEGDVAALVDRLGLGQSDALRAGVTLLGDLLVLRVLSAEAPDLRATLLAAWELLRPRVLGRPPKAPRIWRT